MSGEKPIILYHSEASDLMDRALDAKQIFDAHQISYVERPFLDDVLKELNRGIQERSGLIDKILASKKTSH